MAVLIQGDARFPRAERTQPSRDRCLLSQLVRRCRKALVILFLLSSISEIVPAQTSPTEYQLKAAFIYNFAKFVEWPRDSFASLTDPLRICVLGDSTVAADLRNIIADKSIGSHPVRVRRAEISDIQGCHVLFIGPTEAYRVQQALQAAQSASVLTIGDSPGFLDQGGMINLVSDQNRIRFEVNLKASQGARLQLSSKLLSLAKSVQM